MTNLSDTARGLSRAQRAMVALIEREFAAAGLPVEIAVAAVVNAVAESSLNPRAINPAGTCVGLFQLHQDGAGAGLTVEQRQDPTVNTRRILRVLLGAQGKPVLDAIAAGERDVAVLAGLFCRHVERPSNVDAKVAKREALARELFPSPPAADAVSGVAPTLAERAAGLSASKRAMAAVVEREFLAAGVPSEITAAAIVNAAAESDLDPRAVGDGGASVGLFQLHERGAGRGMSAAERMDPVANTRRILQVLLGAEGAPVLAAYRAGERDVGRLAALFSTHVERPLHKAAEEARRTALAARLFPGLALPPAAGGGLAALLILLGLAGTAVALRALT